MVPRRPARRGQDLLSFLTTDWFNETIKGRKNKSNNNALRSTDHFDWVQVVQHSTDPNGDIDWLEPAVFYDNHLSPTAEPDDPAKLSICTSVRKPTADNIADDNWGIVQSHLTPGGGPARMAVHGVTYAKFNRTDAQHQYVFLDPNTLELTSSDGGSARIISHTPTTGTVGYGLIKLGAGLGNTKIFYANAGITARGSGSVGSGMEMGYGDCYLCQVFTDTVSGTVKVRQVDPSVQKTVYNMDARAIPPGALVRTIPIDGFYVVEAVVKDIRIDGYDYQLATDIGVGAAYWETWATGGACP